MSQKLGMPIEMKGDCGLDWLPYSRGASVFNFDDQSNSSEEDQSMSDDEDSRSDDGYSDSELEE